uniref:Uncharacterized protein n=1 Tax=Parascaris univalens TaxID=6257 RepID=A0A914ZCB7_PARUN
MLSPSPLADDGNYATVASCSHSYVYELCPSGISGATSSPMPRYRRATPSAGFVRRSWRRQQKQEVAFVSDDDTSIVVGRRRYACYEAVAKEKRRVEKSLDSYRDLRSVCTHLTATTTFANCANVRSYSSVLVFYLHAFSVLACLAATGLCVRATVSNQMPNVSTVLWAHSSPARANPLLRYARAHREPICYVWSSTAPTDLCRLGSWARLKRLREMSVFHRDCTESDNIQVAQLFRLDWRRIKTESDLHANLEHLRPGVDARDCLLARAGTAECQKCFQKMDKSFSDVEKAYDKFNATLHRFDCMLAVDTASATRPFSPNGSCADCKSRFRMDRIGNWIGLDSGYFKHDSVNFAYLHNLHL